MPPAVPRRSVLQSLAVGLAAALSACVAPSAGGDDSPTDRTSTPTAPTPTDAPTAVKHVEIGERTGDVNPYSVEVWNAADRERTVAVRVVDMTASETLYDAEMPLPANGTLEISLRAPHTYRVEVSVPAADLHRTVQVTDREFDTCNEYRTTVVLRADEVDVRTMRTQLLCRTVTEG